LRVVRERFSFSPNTAIFALSTLTAFVVKILELVFATREIWMKNLNRLTVFAAGLLFAGIPGSYAKDINFGWPSDCYSSTLSVKPNCALS